MTISIGWFESECCCRSYPERTAQSIDAQIDGHISQRHLGLCCIKPVTKFLSKLFANYRSSIAPSLIGRERTQG